MTNKQKYYRLTWFLVGGALSLFLSTFIFISNIDYYAKNHSWFLIIYFTSLFILCVLALWTMGKYEDERTKERDVTNKQKLDLLRKNLKEFSDNQIIEFGGKLGEATYEERFYFYLELASRWFDSKKRKKIAQSVY